MVFDAVFPVGQGTHFMPGFGEKAVVFWAAFSDARFAAAGAMWVGIPCDGQEHFIDHRGDCSGFVFGPGGGIGELAHGIQAAFEREALEVNVMDEGGFRACQSVPWGIWLCMRSSKWVLICSITSRGIFARAWQ